MKWLDIVARVTLAVLLLGLGALTEAQLRLLSSAVCAPALAEHRRLLHGGPGGARLVAPPPTPAPVPGGIVTAPID